MGGTSVVVLVPRTRERDDMTCAAVFVTNVTTPTFARILGKHKQGVPVTVTRLVKDQIKYGNIRTEKKRVLPKSLYSPMARVNTEIDLAC